MHVLDNSLGKSAVSDVITTDAVSFQTGDRCHGENAGSGRPAGEIRSKRSRTRSAGHRGQRVESGNPHNLQNGPGSDICIGTERSSCHVSEKNKSSNLLLFRSTSRNIELRIETRTVTD